MCENYCREEKLEAIPDPILDLPELDVTVKFAEQIENPDRHLLPEHGQYNASFSAIVCILIIWKKKHFLWLLNKNKKYVLLYF